MNQIILRGIDGQTLWGFLAALGTLSLLDEHSRQNEIQRPRLAFMPDGAAVLETHVEEEELAFASINRLRVLKAHLHQAFKDVNRPADFTKSSFDAIARAEGDPIALDLLAGLACVVGDDASESTLCAANGASHQNLIQSMRDVLQLVDEEHIRCALMEPWKRTYRVPDGKRKELQLGARKPTLRLDPADERLYAMRLTNPTTTDDFATEIGAQALAIAAFTLLPVMPSRHCLTVASHRSRQRVTFSWPLWGVPATLPTVRSLVWEGVRQPKDQRERGVFAAFSTDRVTGDKGKLSFAPTQGLW